MISWFSIFVLNSHTNDQHFLYHGTKRVFSQLVMSGSCKVIYPCVALGTHIGLHGCSRL